MINGLYHVAVYTNDIEESLEFYKNILGFKDEWYGTVNHTTGLIKAAIIKLGSFSLELVSPADPGRVSNNAGPIQHIAFQVKGIESVMRKLNEKCIVIAEDGCTELHAFNKAMKHCFIYGPSNERIEIVEEIKDMG